MTSGDREQESPSGDATARRRLRVLRGSSAAAIAVLFASTAHTLSGGSAPPLWLAVAVTILATPVCIALLGSGSRRADRPGSLWRLAAAVGTAQFALHGAFATIGTASPAASGTSPSGGHHHVIELAHLASGTSSAATTMLLGHIASAAVTFVALAWGERLAAIIARGIRELLRRGIPVHTHRPTTVAATWRTAPLLPSRLMHCAQRRGPPRLRALLTA